MWTEGTGRSIDDNTDGFLHEDYSIYGLVFYSMIAKFPRYRLYDSFLLADLSTFLAFPHSFSFVFERLSSFSHRASIRGSV